MKCAGAAPETAFQGGTMSSSWGCPHEDGGTCLKVKNLPCDPGMKGCVLYGRFVFSNPAKNRPVVRKEAEMKDPRCKAHRR